jgi:outer membrane protein assembly factor BamA
MSLVLNKIPRNCFFVIICLVVSANGGLLAQDRENLPGTAEKNPKSEAQGLAAAPQQTPPEAEEQPRRRIVEGRPRLYLFKHVVNPLTGMNKLVKGTMALTERRILALAERGREVRADRGMQFFLSGAGSGSGMGSGVRFFDKNLFGTGIRVDAPFLITYKNYQLFTINVAVPLLGNDRLNFDLGSTYRSRTKDNFWRIGNDTLYSDRTKFRSITREVRSGFSSRMTEHWHAGLHVSYRNIGITKPANERFESTQDAIDLGTLPGRRGAELLSGILTLENDTKDNKYIPSTGGLRYVEVSLNEGLRGGDLSFWTYRLELQQFVPLGKTGRKILALRALFETNQDKGGSQIPFFELTALGGSNTVRSFENHRYWDKSGVAFLAEYRYRVWRAFDWALFMEQAQVAPEPGDFGWTRFHSGYGVRFIIRATPTVPLSFDFAHGGDGWRVYFRFKPSF